jgi:hypothetical protein
MSASDAIARLVEQFRANEAEYTHTSWNTLSGVGSSTYYQCTNGMC